MKFRPSGQGAIGRQAIALLAGGAMGLSLHAAGPPVPGAPPPDDMSNPYAIIMERNIFHLTAPPPPPEPEKPKVELPDIKITGFLNISGHKRVLFVSHSKDKKEPIYYSLSEGDQSSDGHLKLLKISAAQDSVDVLNDGTSATLSVKKDSLAPNTAAAAPPPGVPGAQPPGLPPPAVANPIIPGAPPNNIPGRQLFMPGRPGRGPNGSPFGNRRQNLPQ